MHGITREKLIEMVKGVGLEIAEKAEDIVGQDVEMLAELDILCEFESDGPPYIHVDKRYASRNVWEVLMRPD